MSTVEWDLNIERIIERNYFSLQHYVVLLIIKDEIFQKGIVLFRSRNGMRVPFHAPLRILN